MLVYAATSLVLFILFHAEYAAADPAAILAIQNTINTYPLAIDSKNFTALSLVFVPDAIANYSAPIGVLDGLAAIQSTLAKNLAPITTQHALSTHVVELAADGQSARTRTYYTATHLGHGVYEGEVYVAYGRYEDELVPRSEGWRITRRHLIYMGASVGNPLIFVNTNTTVAEPSL